MQSNNNNYRMLAFNTTAVIDDRTFKNLTLVNSPIDCLNKAMKNNYNLVVIFDDHRSHREREALVELCSALKRNIHTKHIPLLYLLTSRHRVMLEHLRDVGVEYVKFYDPLDANLKNQIETVLVNSPEECKIDRILSEICPHINYFPISRHKEILYCSAYQNRLVLGSYRLKHLCEIPNHKSCEYFKCPKIF